VARWIDELEAKAARSLPAPVMEYFWQGAGAGWTAAEARQAWSALRYRPHVLRDVTTVDTTTSVLGTPVAAPVLVAPSTLQLLAHPDGDIAMARGTLAAGSLLGVSSNTGVPFDQIGGTGAPWWLQVYMLQQREATARLIDRAVEAGARAIVLTVDTPVVSTKWNADSPVWDLVRDDQIDANLDIHGDHPGLAKARDLTGESIDWLSRLSGLPVVVKGVLRGDDSVVAADAGASGIVVSNHGGRQLDQAISTVRALPDVVAAVGDRVEVYVDGGVRTGIDILGALAMGGTAVFVGRFALWALVVEGASGIERLLRDLGAELAEAMTLAGCSRLSHVTADLLDFVPSATPVGSA
jgi:4-hydroxymandelate oxidase